jgi:hypothetical protein
MAAAAIMGTPTTTVDAPALTDSTEQMEAMDRMDDDGSPESEEAHTVAADTVDQALGAQAEPSAPADDSIDVQPPETTPGPSYGGAEAPSTLENPGVAPGQVERPDPQGRPEENRATTISEQAPSTLRPLASLEVAPGEVEGPEPQRRPDEARGTAGSGQAPSTGSGQAVSDPDPQ